MFDLFNPPTGVLVAVQLSRPALFPMSGIYLTVLLHRYPNYEDYIGELYTIPSWVTCMDLLDRGDVVIVHDGVLYLCPLFTDGRDDYLPGDETVLHLAQLAARRSRLRRRLGSCTSVEIICDNAGRV
ncbi:TPA: hypothetical protein ACHGKB_001386 [Escherichia coli]